MEHLTQTDTVDEQGRNNGKHEDHLRKTQISEGNSAQWKQNEPNEAEVPNRRDLSLFRGSGCEDINQRNR